MRNTLMGKEKYGHTAMASVISVRHHAARANVFQKAVSVLLSALLVVTMNPIANDMSALAQPSEKMATGGGVLIQSPPLRETKA